ncbi:metallophosphoesterase, partial [bacterium]|nr:metallophosphoesterase [bacterium]
MKELVNKWRGDMRIAVMLAAGISLYCFITNALTINASHEDKIFGSYGIFRQLSIALSFPSVVVVRIWEHGAGNVLSNDDLWHFLCLNFLSYTLLFFVCLRLYRWWTGLPNDPLSKRRRCLLLGAVAGAGAVGSGLYFRKDIDTVEVVRQPLPLPNLHPSLQGLKLILMADWHRGPFIGMDYLDRVAQLCNAEKPDIVCIAGDYIYEDSKYFADVNTVLKRLDVSVALLGTLGNHDHWQG